MNPFAYEFMRDAFAACTIVGIVAGAIGYFLVLRGETFAGHALSHLGFPGATGAVLIGLSPFAGLTIATILGGIGIALLGERAHRDVAIGVVLTFSLGLGLLFLHFYTAYASLATNILFGNVLGIAPETVRTLAVLGLVCLVGLAAIMRPLVFSSLQPELAEARGVNTRLVSVLFMGLLALSTAQTIQIVGILLSFSLLVAPAASAVRLTTTIRAGLTTSIVLAVVLAWAGLTLAFYTDWPTSFWITTLGSLLYLVAIAVRRRLWLRP
jgi:zinc/manganese transport system permease protein